MAQITEQIKRLENLINLDPQNIINYFDLGNIYIKLKRYDLALKNFQKTVEIDQKFLQGYNNIANIHRELKNTEESIKYFKKAIKINPNYINAIFNLAVVYSEIGEDKASANYFMMVLKINPNHIPTLNNFGILLKNSKKYSEAMICFEKIIKIDSNFLRAYNNIGTIALELGDIKKSINSYKKAFNLNPNTFTSYRNLLAVYENSNQIESYEKILKLTKEKFPNENVLNFYDAVLLFRKKRYKESINLLEKNLFENELEIKRNFFLGKSYDLINQTASAFKHFNRANKLTENSLEAKKFDKNKYLSNIDYRKKYFTKHNINKWKPLNYSSNNLNPVFLIGFPRSGTTLLDTILRSHPKIEVIEEEPMVLNMLSVIKKNKFDYLKNISSNKINELQKRYKNELRKHVENTNKSKLYIDKLPLNIINAGEISRIFPNAKFILALRHPVDCVLSCYMQDFKLNDAMNNFINLGDSANLYRKTMKLWEQYTSTLKINYISIKYENLITDLEINIKTIVKFLDLNWDQSMLNYRKTAFERNKISTPSYYQVIQPIYKHADQRWRRYKKYLTDIEPILSEFIDKYKY